MMRLRTNIPILIAMLLILQMCSFAMGDPAPKATIPPGSKVFIASMPDEFHTYLKTALTDKKVPLVVVDDKAKADYEITGVSETQKAGKAKKIIMLDWRSNEQASISITDLKTSAVVFAYSVNKQSSAHGKKSTAESCAKHIKEAIKENK